MTESRHFHFVDILGLHLLLPLEVPEGRNVLALLHHLTGIHLPLPQLYPLQVIELCQHYLRAQFPWLRGVKTAPYLTDPVLLWVWVDLLQRRLSPPDSDDGRAISVEPLPPRTVEYYPMPTPLRDAMRQFGIELDELPEEDG